MVLPSARLARKRLWIAQSSLKRWLISVPILTPDCSPIGVFGSPRLRLIGIVAGRLPINGMPKSAGAVLSVPSTSGVMSARTVKSAAGGEGRQRRIQQRRPGCGGGQRGHHLAGQSLADAGWPSIAIIQLLHRDRSTVEPTQPRLALRHSVKSHTFAIDKSYHTIRLSHLAAVRHLVQRNAFIGLKRKALYFLQISTLRPALNRPPAAKDQSLLND